MQLSHAQHLRKTLQACQNLRKTNDPTPRKYLDRQADGLTEVQTDSASQEPSSLSWVQELFVF